MTDKATIKHPEAGKARRALQRRTALAALILFIPFCGCMYLLFGGKDEQADKHGINLTIPDGRQPKIEGSKTRAIERVRAEKVATLDENYDMMIGQDRKTGGYVPAAAQRSEEALRTASERIGNFQQIPSTDPEVERLRRELQAANERLEARTSTPVADPIELAERQYELAARLLSRSDTAGKSAIRQPVGARTEQSVRTVRSLGSTTVSRLESEADTLPAGVERNLGFITAVGLSETDDHTGIRVCVDQDQTLTAGERIRLRLLESIEVAGRVIPSGTVIYGVSGLAGERLTVSVTGIECGGSILPVALEAHDLDGGRGLYVPGSRERTAAKDAAAAVGSGLGQSISFTRSAGQQVAMDLTRGVVTGGTQYLAGKLREVKVSVKAGYQLILVSKK